jgi:predicted transcriptional regulator of viral defense system
VTTRDGVPVTTVIRTLSDVADTDPGTARQAAQEVLDLSLVSMRRLQASVDERIAHLVEHVGSSSR